MSTTDSDEAPAARLGRVALIALAAGLVVGIALVVALSGNPLSDANEVRYVDGVVGSVSDAGDQICWQDVADRDAPQTCAILALDPQSTAPVAGQSVTLGVVSLSTPDGQTPRQVVYATTTGTSSDSSEPAGVGGASEST